MKMLSSRSKRSALYPALGLLLAFTSTTAPALAAPTNYTINFSATTGTAPTAGSFTYDPTSGFSNFLVTWNSQTFNLSAIGVNTGSTGCTGEANTPDFEFSIMSKSAANCLTSPAYEWVGVPRTGGMSFEFDLGVQNFNRTDSIGMLILIPGAVASPSSIGTYAISAVTTSTPEPSTFWGMLCGSLALAGWKRARVLTCLGDHPEK